MYVFAFSCGYALGGSVVKTLPASAEGLSSVSGLKRSSGGGNGNLLQYTCLGNPMDRGAWWATVHGVAKSRTQLSDQVHTHVYTSLSFIQC